MTEKNLKRFKAVAQKQLLALLLFCNSAAGGGGGGSGLTDPLLPSLCLPICSSNCCCGRGDGRGRGDGGGGDGSLRKLFGYYEVIV